MKQEVLAAIAATLEAGDRAHGVFTNSAANYVERARELMRAADGAGTVTLRQPPVSRELTTYVNGAGDVFVRDPLQDRIDANGTKWAGWKCIARAGQVCSRHPQLRYPCAVCGRKSSPKDA